VLAIIAAVVVLLKSPTTQVHVSGGPTPSTAPQPTLAASSSSAVTQREVAIYAALLRNEIGQLMPTGTATSQSPSGSTFYVQNELFALAPTATATDPNRFTTLTQAGPVSAAVQEGIVNALAPIPIVFVPKVEAVEVPVPSAPGCTTVPGAGYVLMLGSIPATGDRIQVYAGWVNPAAVAGHNAVYALIQTGNSWRVTCTVGPEQSSLGGCG
jgi:hypothetical protein